MGVCNYDKSKVVLLFNVLIQIITFYLSSIVVKSQLKQINIDRLSFYFISEPAIYSASQKTWEFSDDVSDVYLRPTSL